MGPLAGVKVLDLSKYGPSRYTFMILSDLGAEVIVKYSLNGFIKKELLHRLFGQIPL